MLNCLTWYFDACLSSYIYQNRPGIVIYNILCVIAVKLLHTSYMHVLKKRSSLTKASNLQRFLLHAALEPKEEVAVSADKNSFVGAYENYMNLAPKKKSCLPYPQLYHLTFPLSPLHLQQSLLSTPHCPSYMPLPLSSFIYPCLLLWPMTSSHPFLPLWYPFFFSHDSSIPIFIILLSIISYYSLLLLRISPSPSPCVLIPLAPSFTLPSLILTSSISSCPYDISSSFPMIPLFKR